MNPQVTGLGVLSFSGFGALGWATGWATAFGFRPSPVVGNATLGCAVGNELLELSHREAHAPVDSDGYELLGPDELVDR